MIKVKTFQDIQGGEIEEWISVNENINIIHCHSHPILMQKDSLTLVKDALLIIIYTEK